MLTLIKTRGPQAWTFMAQEVIKLQIDPICWRTCFSFSWSAEGFITLYSPAGLRQTHFSWKLFWDLWWWTADQRDSKWARGAKHGILILNRERFSMELGVKMIAGVSTKPTFHFISFEMNKQLKYVCIWCTYSEKGGGASYFYLSNTSNCHC